MKTIVKQYSIESLLGKKSDSLCEIQALRQAEYQENEEYKFLLNELNLVMEKIKDNSTKNDITDCVSNIESAVFDAGYKAGIADLMTSLTFNKLSITNAEYYDLKE